MYKLQQIGLTQKVIKCRSNHHLLEDYSDYKLGVIITVLAIISVILIKEIADIWEHNDIATVEQGVQTGCKQAKRLARLLKSLYLMVKPRVTAAWVLQLCVHNYGSTVGLS